MVLVHGLMHRLAYSWPTRQKKIFLLKVGGCARGECAERKQHYRRFSSKSGHHLDHKTLQASQEFIFFFFFLIVWGGKRGVISYTWSGAHQQKQEGRGWLCVSSDAQPKITESFWFYIHRTTPKLDVWMPVEKKANRKPHDCWHGCARFI